MVTNHQHNSVTMKRIILNTVSLAILLTAVACNDYYYPDLSYKGPVLIEIKNNQFQRGTFVRVLENTEFGREVADSLGFGTPAGQRDSFLVQLIGPHQPNAVVVNFSIAELPDAAATPPIIGAQPGVHYNMITTGNTVTIPAGQSSAWIRIAPIRVLGAANPIQRRRLRLTLTGTAQGLGISPNAANFDYTIRD